jgi:hypothetical protein
MNISAVENLGALSFSRGNVYAKGIERDEAMAKKRSIFVELMEGVSAMKKHREDKFTLRSYTVDAEPLPKVGSKLLRDTR